jgi:hypothetical protein
MMTSKYIAKLQYSKQYGTGIKIDTKTNGTKKSAQK